MSKREESLQVIDTEILSCCKTLESVTHKQIESVKKEQAEVVQKIAALLQQFEQIQEKLPKEDLQGGIQRLNNICDRLDLAKKRVQLVIQKTETMKLALDYKPPAVKTQTAYYVESYTK